MSIAPTLSDTRCIHDEHSLLCSCGDALERVPVGDEWHYRSLRTGKALESHLPKVLEVMTWEELALSDPALYSMLRAREVLGMLYSRHNHAPKSCGEHQSPVPTPECCDWPMRLSPDGWVCRVEEAA